MLIGAAWLQPAEFGRERIAHLYDSDGPIAGEAPMSFLTRFMSIHELSYKKFQEKFSKEKSAN